MPVRSAFLRTVAGCELDKAFPGITRARRDELVTAVVRQWLTYGGWAGVVTVPVNFRFHFFHEGTKVFAGVKAVPSNLPQSLASWRVRPEELSDIVQELTLAQVAVFVNRDGLRVRVRAVPQEQGFEFGEAGEGLG